MLKEEESIMRAFGRVIYIKQDIDRKGGRNKYFILAFTLGLAIFLISCSVQEAPGPGGGYNPYAEEVSGDVKDRLGASMTGKDYLDLVYSTSTSLVTIVGTTLTCVITVDDIPQNGMLTFNHTALGSNLQNYSWAVEFDTNGNGTTDYSLAAMKFKWGGEVYAKIEDTVQCNLWQHTGGGSASVLGFATLTVNTDEDTFTMAITHSTVASLITGNTVIMVTTFMDDGSNSAPFEDGCKFTL
jgi:hypothetical protein